MKKIHKKTKLKYLQETNVVNYNIKKERKQYIKNNSYNNFKV